MKNQPIAPGFSVKMVLKFFINAYKSIFESGDRREFKRWKDYIAS